MFNLAWTRPKVLRFLPKPRFWLKPGQRQVVLIFVLAVGLVGFLSLAAPVRAGIDKFVYNALSYILEAVAAIFSSLLLWVIHYLIVLSGYNNFLNARVVSVGWSLTRDVANMFYILVMLLIAFGTMFKVEQYSWKKLLPRLILTAVFVNFSKTIIGLFIDFAQVIMLTFVNGYAAVAGGNFVQMFGLDKMFGMAKQGGILGSDMSFELLLGYLLGTVLLGVALIVTAVFAAILLFRIITLWVLIVLAPIAFLLGTFPKGQEYYSDWWKRLTNQIIVGPMIAFFLWLSLAAMGGSGQYSQLTEGNALPSDLLEERSEAGQAQKVGGAAITDIAQWENLGSFAAVIAMLFVALQFTQQLGVAGAGLASGAAGWMKNQATSLAKKAAVPAALGVATGGLVPGLLAWGGLKAGKWGTKELALGTWSRTKKELNERLPAWANVPAQFAAWKERAKEKEEHAKKVALARQKSRYYKNKHGVSLPFEAQLEEAKANENYKLFADLSQEEQVKIAEKLYHAGNDTESRRMRMTVYRIMQRSGFVDDASSAMKEILNEKNQKAPRSTSAEREFTGKFLLGDDFFKLNKEERKKRMATRQQELRLITGKQGFDATHPEYSFWSDADPENAGQLMFTEEEYSDERTSTEVNKGGANRPRDTSPHYFWDLDENGKIVGLRQVTYHKSDGKKAAKSAFEDVYGGIEDQDLNRNKPQERIWKGLRTGMVGSKDYKELELLNTSGFLTVEKAHLERLKEMARINPYFIQRAFAMSDIKGIKVEGKEYDDIFKAMEMKASPKPKPVKKPAEAAEASAEAEAEEIPKPPDMRQETPNAMVKDGIISGATSTEPEISSFVRELESLTESLAQAGQNFEAFISTLSAADKLKEAAKKIGEKEKDPAKKDVLANLQQQLVVPDTQIRQLIYQLWLNTKSRKEEKEKEEKKKKEGGGGTEAPPVNESKI